MECAWAGLACDERYTKILAAVQAADQAEVYVFHQLAQVLQGQADMRSHAVDVNLKAVECSLVLAAAGC